MKTEYIEYVNLSISLSIYPHLKHPISLTPNHAQNSSDFQDNFHSQKSRFKGGKITFHSLTKCDHS